jgi:PAS domain S-box-containing protein
MSGLTEAVLLGSEELFRLVVERVSDGVNVCEFDPATKERRLVFANDRYVEMSGYTREELERTPDLNTLTDVAPDCFRPKFFYDCILSGKPYRGVASWKRPDGKHNVFEFSAVSVKVGERYIMLGVDRDVTAQHAALQELRSSEERYRSLIDDVLHAAHVGALIIDRDGLVAWANDTFARYFGVAAEDFVDADSQELAGGPLRERVQDKDAFEQAFLAAARGQAAARFECHVLAVGDRPERWVECRSAPVTGGLYSGGRVLVFYDVTERKRAAEALRVKDAAITSSASGMALAGWDGCLTYVNESFVRMWGYAGDWEVLGRSALEFWQDGDAALTAMQAIRERGAWFGEMVGKRKNGSTFHVRTSANAVSGEDGEPGMLIASFIDVTEQKDAQEALSVAEERYRLISENATDLISIHDMAGLRYLYVNPAVVRILGYAADELLGTPAADLIHEDDRSLVLAAYQHAKKMGTGSAEFRYRRKDGTYCWLAAAGRLVGSETDSPLVLLISRDVTKRKAAEQALRESEENYRLLIQSLNEGIWAIDASGYTTFVNPRMAEMLGYDEEEMVGMHLFDFMDEEGKVLCRELLGRREEGVREDHDFEFLRKDGNRIYARVATSPITNPDGSYAGALAGVIDITRRRQMEQALRKTRDRLEVRVRRRTEELTRLNEALRISEAQFRHIYDNSPVMMHSINQEGVICNVNRRWLEEMGYGRDEVLGRPAASFMTSESAERALPIIRQFWIDGSARDVSYQFVKRDGSLIDVLLDCDATVDPAGNRVSLSVVRDITLRRQAEERLKAYHEQLQSLASEASLAEERERRRIAAELHDSVGQMLAACRIKLGALSSTMPPDHDSEAFQDVLSLMERCIQSTRALTFQLSPPVLYELGFLPAVDWLTEQVSELYGIRTRFVDRFGGPKLDEDISVLLFQATRELLFNVAKHARATEATVTVANTAERVLIVVEDDGVGFEVPGIALQPGVEGGFGLFNIRERLSHFGGGLDVESAEDAGSRVTLFAPLCRADRGPQGGVQ